jgi:hypothetical protein
VTWSPEELTAWRSRYSAASEALEQADLQEIAALTTAEALHRTLSLRLFGEGPLPSSRSSGLVEQQALFHRQLRR